MTLTAWPSLSATLRVACVAAFASSLLPVGAAAQVVSGRVVDAMTGAHVAGASIAAVGPDDERRAAVLSDSTGHFVLPVSAGRFGLRVEHFGYETLETEPLEFGQGERVQVEIRIGPLPFEVEPLVVQARQRTRVPEFERRMRQQQRMGLGRFITRADIESSAVIGINELLTRELGLELTTIQGAQVVMIRARGSACLPSVYIDGIPVVNDTQFPVDLSRFFATPDAIEGIEIYRTPLATPVELRAGGCGAIVVWTRSDVEGKPFTWRRVAIAAGWIGVFMILRAL